MQLKREQPEPTKFKLTIVANATELEAAKSTALDRLSQNVKVPGFRAGKAPAKLVEKQLDPSALQSEFLDQAVNQLYSDAVNKEKLRPVAQPQISITKFVPFSTLEFTAEAEAVGDIKSADYKKIKLAPKPVEVSAAEVNKVIENLQQRAAIKSEVKRAAKNGDEVTINFDGSDAESGEPIEGAAGQDYPLVLGSKNFIPGFEEQLVGLKAGSDKSFEITFPADYSVPSLQKRKVKFAVKVSKVQEMKLPKVDEAFAKTLGPFKSVAELKADAKKELIAEKTQQQRRAYETELLEKIAAKTEVAIPPALVDEELNRLEEEEKRDLAYRGQTWQEHIEAEGVTAEEHRQRNRAGAETRVKAGLILGEIADQEKISITPEDLKVRIKLLKGQYPDPAMQAELDKPDNQRDVLSRMMTEKTLDLLTSSASALVKSK
jgi:trigger factor